MTSEERIRKFLNWSNYELVIRFDRECFWVSIYFKRVAVLREPKAFIAIDKNFDNVTLAVFSSSGKILRVKRFRAPLRRMLIHRIWVERIQRRYPRSWRFISGVRESIRKHGERMRSIAGDYSYKIANIIADIADEYSALVIQEDLRNIRENAKRSESFNKKLSLWFYRRLSFAIWVQTPRERLETRYVDPKNHQSALDADRN